jgi:hypothetical protein
MAAHGRRSDVGRRWTDEEISILESMWPNAPVSQIAARVRRSYGTVYDKAKQLRKMGLLGNGPRSRSIKPDLQDFDEVKMDYCCKHNITIAALSERLKGDDQLLAKLYRLAVARLKAAGQGNSPVDLGSP